MARDDLALSAALESNAYLAKENDRLAKEADRLEAKLKDSRVDVKAITKYARTMRQERDRLRDLLLASLDLNEESQSE